MSLPNDVNKVASEVKQDVKNAESYFVKYKHDFAILFGVLAIGIIAVLGQHFSDLAKKPFWWTFWDVATYTCILAWVGFFLWQKNKQKSQSQDQA